MGEEVQSWEWERRMGEESERGDGRGTFYGTFHGNRDYTALLGPAAVERVGHWNGSLKAFNLPHLLPAIHSHQVSIRGSLVAPLITNTRVNCDHPSSVVHISIRT